MHLHAVASWLPYDLLLHSYHGCYFIVVSLPVHLLHNIMNSIYIRIHTALFIIVLLNNKEI